MEFSYSLGGRTRVYPPSAAREDRYRFMSPGEAEPNLGVPILGFVPPLSAEWVLVTDLTGGRYWTNSFFLSNLVLENLAVLDQSSVGIHFDFINPLFPDNTTFAVSGNTGLIGNLTISPTSGNNSAFFVVSGNKVSIGGKPDSIAGGIGTFSVSGFSFFDGSSTITDTLSVPNIITRVLSSDELFVKSLTALSAIITVLDIKTFELSGYAIKGDLNVTGTVSATNAVIDTTFTNELTALTATFNHLTVKESLCSVGHTNVIDVSTNNPALRITQRGMGPSIVVEDSPNPDATPLVVNSLGQLIVGSLSAPFGDQRQGIHTVSNDLSDPRSNIQITKFGNNVLDPNGRLRFILSRGTLESPQIVENGDDVGAIAWAAYTGEHGGAGSPIKFTSLIQSYIDGVPSLSSAPGKLVFSTSSEDEFNNSELYDRMVIDSLGRVGINTQTPNELLTVNGNISATGTVVIDTSSFDPAFSVNQRSDSNAVSVSGNTTLLGNLSTVGTVIVNTTANKTAFIIQENGFVGLGTKSANEQLTVVGNVSAVGSVSIESTDIENTALRVTQKTYGNEFIVERIVPKIENFLDVFNLYTSFGDAVTSSWRMTQISPRGIEKNALFRVTNDNLGGFASPFKYENYTQEVRLFSLSPDDDSIGLIIAYKNPNEFLYVTRSPNNAQSSLRVGISAGSSDCQILTATNAEGSGVAYAPYRGTYNLDSGDILTKDRIWLKDTNDFRLVEQEINPSQYFYTIENTTGPTTAFWLRGFTTQQSCFGSNTRFTPTTANPINWANNWQIRAYPNNVAVVSGDEFVQSYAPSWDDSNQSRGWNLFGSDKDGTQGVKIKVVRSNNIITCYTTDFSTSDADLLPYNTGNAVLSTDLNTPTLSTFLGPQSIGYTNSSQPSSFWDVIFVDHDQLNLTRMIINSAGNVGIGTSSPNELLTVNGNISATGTFILGYSNTVSLTSTKNASIFGDNSTINSNLSNVFIFGSNILGEFDNTTYVENLSVTRKLFVDEAKFNRVIIDDLTVTKLSAISATIDYLDIKYFEVSGFNIDGNLTVAKQLTATDAIFQNLSITTLSAVSAVFDVIDIKLYELSGFDVTGNVTVSGNLNVTDDVSVSGTIYTSNLEALSVKGFDLYSARLSTFTEPLTANGDFLVLNINGLEKAIRLWDFQ